MYNVGIHVVLAAVLVSGFVRASVVGAQTQEPDGQSRPHMILVRADSDQGSPVANATVTLNYRAHSVDGQFENRRMSIETDPAGIAVIEIPSSATHPSIRIAKPGFIAQLRRWRTLAELPDELAVVLYPGVSVGGVVRDEQGQPIKDVRVELWIESRRTAFIDPPPGRNILHVDGPLAPRTDAQGRWRYDGVPADAIIRTRLVHPNFCSEDSYVSNRPHLTQEDYRDETAEFVMRAGIELIGRIVDNANRPIEKAVVLIEKDKDPQSRRQSVQTGPDGSFRFRGLASPGKYRLAATANGWAPSLRTVDVSESRNSEVELTLVQGSPLRVKVVDASKQPISATVGLSWEDSVLLGRFEIDGLPDPVVPVRRVDKGVFEWPHAPAGKLKVWVSANNYKSKTIDATAGESEICVELDSFQAVSGTCVDAANDEPIPRFLVFPVLHGVYPDRVYPCVGIQGRFTLSEDIAAFDTEMKLMVEAPGYRTIISSQTLGGKQPAPKELKFRLQRAEDVTGMIVDPNGKPVAAALISVRPTNLLATVAGNAGPEHLRTATNHLGEFQFAAQPQSYSLSAFSAQGSVVRRFGRNQSNLGEIRLQPNAVVRGVVVSDGAPVEGATVNVFFGFGSDYDLTDADGQFEFLDVPGGSISLHATLPIHSEKQNSEPERVSKSINLSPGDSANVTVEFDR